MYIKVNQQLVLGLKTMHPLHRIYFENNVAFFKNFNKVVKSKLVAKNNYSDVTSNIFHPSFY